MLGQSLEQEAIHQAFKQFYQSRSPTESQIVFAVIMQAFPNITHQKLKLYSFFASILELGSGQEILQTTRTWYLIQKNQQNAFQSHQIIHRFDLAKFDLNKLTIYISPEGKAKCLLLNSVDQQIKWLQHNQYFQQIPRKRLYNLLRKSQLLATTFNNNVYCEGDMLELGHTPIYLVKEGEFNFKKMNKQQNIMLYNFGVGEIFGHQEMFSEQSSKKRLFTVNCRSSIGVVYKISEDFFDYYLRKSCQQLLRKNLQKVSKFICKHLQKVQINRQKNEYLLTQTLSLRKSVSTEANTFITIPKLLKSPRATIAEEFDQKTKREQKLPLISVKSVVSVDKQTKRQKITMTNPQYQQDAKMLNKKLKIQAIRNCSNRKNKETRGQILLNLIKNSLYFQRNRRKNILINT